MFVVIVAFYRRLSVMKTDLVNRTSQHNYIRDSSDSSDSREVNNNPSLATPNAPELTPDTIANNPMYVVNFSNGKLDKYIKITRKKNSPGRVPKRETENVYQEPPEYRWGLIMGCFHCCLLKVGNNHCLLSLLCTSGSCPR